MKVRRKIVILHYHLHRGGVTSVIRSQVAALHKADYEVSLLVGECSNPNSWECPVKVFPQLNYLKSPPQTEEEAHRMADDIEKILRQEVRNASILHAHNVNLGKNPILSCVIWKLVQQGQMLFNHIHDFAEDRPQNMENMAFVCDFLDLSFHQVCYPELPNVRYGVLTQEDSKRVVAQSLPQKLVFWIPNAVAPVESLTAGGEAAKKRLRKHLGLASKKKIVTYPVRVIRRKNIGEFILWSLLFNDLAEWLVTLPPENPEERKFYNTWKTYVANVGCSVHFEVGLRADFNDIMQGSDFCFTTSKQEGFGMVYVEPWLFHTPVIGRNLHLVVRDFVDEGMHFPFLYNQLLTPEGSDFAYLTDEAQREVITKVKNQPEYREQLERNNPYLNQFPPTVEDSLIEENKDLVTTNYSLSNYGQRLAEAYASFAETC